MSGNVNRACLHGVTSYMQELRHAVRLLTRNPLFAITAALSLAIGIGANTTIFTIADALLFRAPVGVVDAKQLVDIGRSQEGKGFDTNSYPNYLDVRARNTVFSDVYAHRFDPQPMSLGTTQGAERIDGGVVSSNYFAVLGTRAAVGRLFASTSAAEVVLTHRLWTRRFGKDPN